MAGEHGIRFLADSGVLCVARKHWNADRILRMEQPHCNAWSHEPFSGYVRLRALALYKETMQNSKTFSGMSAVRSFRAIIPIDEEKERTMKINRGSFVLGTILLCYSISFAQ
jgi:hypothetical protein